MTTSSPGLLLREWRTRRRYSQLDLSVAAEVSTRHLSYIETGRSKPSPEMIIHLCEHLAVPMRTRNEILLAAGFAPRYRQTRLEPAIDSELVDAVEQVVRSHGFPAVVVDGHWNLVTTNAAAGIFLDGVAPRLLDAPVNVIRLSLHPDGLAPRILNLEEYTGHLLLRVRRAIDHAPSPTLEAILDEFGHLATAADVGSSQPQLLLPLQLASPRGGISLFSTITTFGSPRDATLEELAIETFYPADSDSKVRLTEYLSSAGLG